MGINAVELADRLVRRLADSDPAQVRLGVRSVTHQVVQRRLNVIRELRPRIALLFDSKPTDYNRAIYECLLQILMAAESSLLAGESVLKAKTALLERLDLRKVFLKIAEGPITGGEITNSVGLSRMEVDSLLRDLRVLDLVMEYPGNVDVFKRPHMLTGLGQGLLLEVRSFSVNSP